ncbi:MAG: ABC transporter permease [Chitinophagaceae bacterium]|nr:ABC transporter permease [Chitinophagaceae bacterium]
MAWKNLWRDKFYAGINLFGLSIATAVFLLIINYVYFERSYENIHSNAKNICRVTLDLFKGSEYVTTDCETYPPLGPVLKEKMPEVVDYVRMQNLGTIELTDGNKAFIAEKNYAADPALFTVFSYSLLYGDKRTVLSKPGDMVVTETVAKKIFGKTNVLGKTLKMRGEPFIVTGIAKDVPENTHLKFDFLISFNTLQKWGWDLNSWGGNNNYLYVQMMPGYNLSAFNQKLKEFSKERLQHEVVTAEPIKGIHLYSHKTFEPETNGDARIVNFLIIISFLIILIGSANYVNLTTARSVEKAKEAGVRKVLGASNTSLIKMFFTESVLLNIIALLCSLIIIKITLPLYSSVIENAANVHIFSTGGFWLTAALVFLINCIFSGLYPAFFLSSVKTTVVTIRNFTGSLKSILLRKVIVVGQFVIALSVVTASVIIYQQLSFVRKQDLGININQVLIVKGPQLSGEEYSSQKIRELTFKNQLLNMPGISGVSLTNSLPGLPLNFLSTSSGIKRVEDASSNGDNYYLYGIDANYLSLMNIPLLKGRNFMSGSPNKDELIINEEAARRLGFASPGEAIGKKILTNSGNIQTGTVVGVIKNYHQQSLKGSLLPMIHWFSEDASGFYAIKISSENISKTIAGVEKLWQSDFRGHVFDYYFLDEMFNMQYKSDMVFGKIVNIFSVFTLLITCLGLLGLAAYSTVKRTKEIGVRRVLGASVNNIVFLLSKEFIKLVFIAIVISVPISGIMMNRWLKDFAYRINIEWWIFVFIGTGAILIALLTISFQAIKAAMANPVKSLRTE